MSNENETKIESMKDVIENASGNQQEDTNDVVAFEDVDLSDLNKDLDESAKESDKKEDESDKEESNEKEDEKEDEKEIDKEKNKEESTSEKLDLGTNKKFFNIKSGNNTVEILKDATITHKIDGKIVELKLQDVLNEYSGNTSLNQRYSKLGEEKQDLQAERNDFEIKSKPIVDNANNFAKAVNSGDVVKALEALANLAGTNPIKLRKNFMEGFRKEAIAYSQLSPEQQKKLDSEWENHYNKQEQKYNLDQKDMDLQLEKTTNKILEFQKNYKISDDELFKLKDQMHEKDKSAIENLNADQYLEALGELHTSNQAQGKASELLSKVDPKYADNVDYVEEVKNFIVKNQDLSDNDILDSIKQALKEEVKDTSHNSGKSNDEDLERKISKNHPNSKSSKEDINTDDLEAEMDFDNITID